MSHENGMIKFYKTFGALQIKVIPPDFKQIETQQGQARWVLDNEGAVLIDLARGIGTREEKSWDWKNKVQFAISFADICQLLETRVSPDDPRDKRTRLRGPGEASLRIVHNLRGKEKALQITPGTGEYEHTWMINVQEGSKQNNDLNRVSVPLTDGEHNMLMRFLTSVGPRLCGLP